MALLGVWFAVNLGVIFFARELASLTLVGWPIPFYMAAQGTTLIYLLIVGGYAYAVNRLEQEAGTIEDREDGHDIE
jgi:putative solute:sodium symporter small subunit